MNAAFKSPLTEAQRELLNLFSHNMSDDDVRDMKEALVEHLSKKVSKQAQDVWEKKGWTNDDMDHIAHTHLRDSL